MVHEHTHDIESHTGKCLGRVHSRAWRGSRCGGFVGRRLRVHWSWDGPALPSEHPPSLHLVLLTAAQQTGCTSHCCCLPRPWGPGHALPAQRCSQPGEAPPFLTPLGVSKVWSPTTAKSSIEGELVGPGPSRPPSRATEPEPGRPGHQGANSLPATWGLPVGSHRP